MESEADFHHIESQLFWLKDLLDTFIDEASDSSYSKDNQKICMPNIPRYITETPTKEYRNRIWNFALLFLYTK